MFKLYAYYSKKLKKLRMISPIRRMNVIYAAWINIHGQSIFDMYLILKFWLH